MNRREALKAVSVIMGGSIIGANAFLTGCGVGTEERVNSLFLESDIALLDEIGGTIIPATDTPGAKEVGIGSFISMMVIDCYKPKDQKAFTEGLIKLKSDFENHYGDNFEEAAPEDRLAYLNALDKEQREHYKAGKHRGKEGKEHYFKMMKELTLLGYFTSEVGCTQARRYVEVPGRYECIDYKKGDRAWAI